LADCRSGVKGKCDRFVWGWDCILVNVLNNVIINIKNNSSKCKNAILVIMIEIWE
jgi:hypothetical protein